MHGKGSRLAVGLGVTKEPASGSAKASSWETEKERERAQRRAQWKEYARGQLLESCLVVRLEKWREWTMERAMETTTAAEKERELGVGTAIHLDNCLEHEMAAKMAQRLVHASAFERVPAIVANKEPSLEQAA